MEGATAPSTIFSFLMCFYDFKQKKTVDVSQGSPLPDEILWLLVVLVVMYW
jgi:hypothetical protein